MRPEYINDIGLVFDIAGAVLLFLFGLPPAVEREGTIHIVMEGVNHDEIAKGRRYDRLGRFGLSLLIVGFFLQALSNHVGN